MWSLRLFHCSSDQTACQLRMHEHCTILQESNSAEQVARDNGPCSRRSPLCRCAKDLALGLKDLLRVINLTLCNSVHQLLCQTACQAWGIYSSSCGPVNNIFFMWIWCVKLWWSFWLAVLHSESALVLKDLFFSLTQNSSFLNKLNAKQCCEKNVLGRAEKKEIGAHQLEKLKTKSAAEPLLKCTFGWIDDKTVSEIYIEKRAQSRTYLRRTFEKLAICLRIPSALITCALLEMQQRWLPFYPHKIYRR